ncbi:hypothetical protein ACOSQ3_010435 [Xanthoceras sorbifolium]
MRAKSLVKNRSPWTNRRVSDITTTNQNTSNQIDKGSRDGARQLHASSSTLLSNKEGHEIGRQTSGSLGTETVEQTHPGEDGEHTPLNTELERKNKGHNSQPLQQSSNMPFGEIADPVKKENFHGKGSNLNHMGHEGNIGLLMSNDELDIESAQAATSTSHSSSNNNMHVHTKGKKGGWKRLAHDIHKVDTIGLSEVLLRKRLWGLVEFFSNVPVCHLRFLRSDHRALLLHFDYQFAAPSSPVSRGRQRRHFEACEWKRRCANLSLRRHG